MAAAVFAVDPAGLGGLVLRAQPGPVRELWLQQFRDLLPADTLNSWEEAAQNEIQS